MEKNIPSPASHNVRLAAENDGIRKNVSINDSPNETGLIAGTVTCKVKGIPLSNALVRITDIDFNLFSQCWSNQEGHFYCVAGSLPCFRVLVSKKGYGTFTSDILSMVRRSDREITIRMQPGETEGLLLYGCVRDMKRKPVANARVTIRPESGPDRVESLLTNQDGDFLFDHLERGLYRITCQAPSYNACTRIVFHDTGNPVDITEPFYLKRIETGGTLFGTVTDAVGFPVQGAAVVAFDSENIPVGFTRTNDRGIYFISGLETGTYRIVTQYAD